MALHSTSNTFSFSFWLCLLLFFCLVSSNSSLSTFSVSESPNQTPLVCALIPSSNGANFLNCSSQFISVNPNATFSAIVSGEGFLCTQLEAGNSHICGILNRTSGFQCWQWPEFKSSSIRENFSSIAVGEDFVCGLSVTSKIRCFGTGNNIRSIVDNQPKGNYSVIAAGFRHVCAISVGGDLHCWGDWVAKNPQAKRSVFCGVLRLNYSLFCWGHENFSSGSMVFERVLPGTCTNTCPGSRILPNSGNLCSPGQQICQSCEAEMQPAPPSPSPQPPPESGSSDWNGKMVALLVVGCAGSLSFVLVSAFFLYKHCKFRGCRVHDSGRLDEAAATSQQGASQSQNPHPPTMPQPQPQPVLEKRLSQLASMGNAGHLEEFSLQILVEATDNFSEERKIGSGSFGSVYRATLQDGRQVAVKRAEVSNTSSYAIGTKRQEDTDHAFINELESLSRLHHKNLVRLLGFCEDCNELVLVFEYIENGTLHDHLHKPQPQPQPQTSSPLMSWPARIKVALDAARGIEYLHEYAVPSIIHRDIKSSNILLDANGTAKVSDFGLSLMGPGEDESHLSLKAAGTVGYMDPEYYRLQQLSKKSDVYSFGVVLLEILTGYKAIHRNENGVPRNVVDFVVPYIVQDDIHRVLDHKMPPPTPFEIEAVAYVGYLAADCVSLEGRDRPSMTEVVNSLERALAACLVPPSLSRSTTASSR
ncbi:serine/threonine-protein kinase-like protein CCR4 [Melia azedarach]|uniref:Serine/threonine-protein kinase-like protein CCR4 n=1 Tax=Melia azedarach TaxID=155640 RepID=A0ACC1XQT1_MELAZ|nr:serine/threonine-protein kinase-like protein CCR4 [Melia azedarach]